MDFSHLDIHSLTVVGPEHVAKVQAGARKSRRIVRRVDFGKIKTVGDLYTVLATALSFPDYFGRNWDATDECMQELSWVKKDATVIVLNADNLRRLECFDCINFVHVFVTAAKRWKERGIDFETVLVGSKKLFNTVNAILRPV